MIKLSQQFHTLPKFVEMVYYFAMPLFINYNIKKWLREMSKHTKITTLDLHENPKTPITKTSY
jgi:hypothetical protein